VGNKEQFNLTGGKDGKTTTRQGYLGAGAQYCFLGKLETSERSDLANIQPRDAWGIPPLFRTRGEEETCYWRRSKGETLKKGRTVILMIGDRHRQTLMGGRYGMSPAKKNTRPKNGDRSGRSRLCEAGKKELLENV